MKKVKKTLRVVGAYTIFMGFGIVFAGAGFYVSGKLGDVE